LKRFYCTICKRVKRVRVIPDSVTKYGDDVRMREGLCAWHTNSRFNSIEFKMKGGNDNGKR